MVWEKWGEIDQKQTFQLHRLNRFWGSETQHGDHGWKYCAVYWTFANKQDDGAHPHQWQPSEITDMLISSAVAIISQSMQLSKHHIPHDKIYHLAHLLFPNKAGELKSIWWISWFLYWAKQLVFTPAVHYSCLRNSTEKKKKLVSNPPKEILVWNEGPMWAFVRLFSSF